MRVDLPSPDSPNKQTQLVLEIAYMIPQKMIHEGQGTKMPPIEGVEQYGSNSAIHPM